MFEYLCILVIILHLSSGLKYNEFNHVFSKNDYTVYWNVTTDEITFKLVVNTEGWIGFGLSSNGSFYNSDFIFVWKDNDGTVHSKDAHSEDSDTLIWDSKINWKMLDFSQKSGTTTVVFKRYLKVCSVEDPEDLKMNNATRNINIEVSGSNYVLCFYGEKFFYGTPNYNYKILDIEVLPLLGSLNQKTVLNMNEVDILEYNVEVNSIFAIDFCFLLELDLTFF